MLEPATTRLRIQLDAAMVEWIAADRRAVMGEAAERRARLSLLRFERALDAYLRR